jgi:hypothetical protein
VTDGSPDPWPAIDELASMLNDLAGQVLTHTTQLQHLTPVQQNTPAGNATAHAKELRRWVEALVDEYGLHAQIGPPDRWENIPPLRAELLGLKIADVRRLKLEQGSFELIYWHDARARIVDRTGQHAHRWQQDQQNPQLLGVAAR